MGKESFKKEEQPISLNEFLESHRNENGRIILAREELYRWAFKELVKQVSPKDVSAELKTLIEMAGSEDTSNKEIDITDVLEKNRKEEKQTMAFTTQFRENLRKVREVLKKEQGRWPTKPRRFGLKKKI